MYQWLLTNMFEVETCKDLFHTTGSFLYIQQIVDNQDCVITCSVCVYVNCTPVPVLWHNYIRYLPVLIVLIEWSRD